MKNICIACKKQDEVLNSVESNIHKHKAAEKAAKKVKAIITFYDAKTNQPAKICKACQGQVVNGFAHGKNYG